MPLKIPSHLGSEGPYLYSDSVTSG